jgi:nuclear pore complex protein Nup98-Nup96
VCNVNFWTCVILTIYFFFFLALLSGNKRLDACEKAQDKSDHYLAMLISLASGPNMTFGQLLQNQLERWQEARADKFIEEKRLKLYSLLSGN